MSEKTHPLEELSQYVDSDLAPARRAAVESHLAACSECAAVVEDLRAVAAFARTLPARPPERDLWPAIEARLPDVAPRGEQVIRFPAWRRRFSFTLPQLAAAGFLLVLLSGSAAWLALRGARGPASVPVAGVTVPESAGGDGFTTARYEAAIQDLQTVLAENRDRLDPQTVRTVEQNLAVIDTAIEQARQALLADPSSQYLNGHLAEQMQRKLRVLQQAAGYVTADYAVAGS